MMEAKTEQSQCSNYVDIDPPPKPQRRCFRRKKRLLSEEPRIQSNDTKRESDNIEGKREYYKDIEMTNLNSSAHSKSLCTNVDADFKEIVNLLPVIHAEIAKARSILKQTNFRNINPNIAEMTTVASEVADVMREAAQAAESNKFSEFCRTIYETCCKLTTTMERLNRVQYDVASQTAERAQPLELLQGEVDYMDQAVYLLYTINLEFQRVLLAGNASYVHGLSHVGDQLSEMEGLKETLTRLLAVVSCTNLSNSSTVEPLL